MDPGLPELQLQTALQPQKEGPNTEKYPIKAHSSSNFLRNCPVKRFSCSGPLQNIYPSLIFSFSKSLDPSSRSYRLLEEGFIKVAIFADSSLRPTHVARQLSNGNWTSKLGQNIDIEHDITGVECAKYGNALRYMKKSTSPEISSICFN